MTEEELIAHREEEEELSVLLESLHSPLRALPAWYAPLKTNAESMIALLREISHASSTLADLSPCTPVQYGKIWLRRASYYRRLHKLREELRTILLEYDALQPLSDMEEGRTPEEEEEEKKDLCNMEEGDAERQRHTIIGSM